MAPSNSGNEQSRLVPAAAELDAPPLRILADIALD
jgi:hypothetical protein